MALWRPLGVLVSPGVDCCDIIQLWSLGKKVSKSGIDITDAFVSLFFIERESSNPLCSMQS